jgi:hypothetical protein
MSEYAAAGVLLGYALFSIGVVVAIHLGCQAYCRRIGRG